MFKKLKDNRMFVSDGVLIGSWEEVAGVKLETITKRSGDDAMLDGLIIKGYETKFGVTNENRERYAPNCLDKFVQEYFIDHKLNMVLNVQHGWGVDDQIGRVIYLEVNTVGFYFVAYVPRSVPRYEQVKALLKEGILQGFSKCGWAEEYEYHYKENGEFDYVEYKDFKLMSVSLVTMPANPIPFEAMGETVRNELNFVNRFDDEPKPKPKKSIYNQSIN